MTSTTVQDGAEIQTRIKALDQCLIRPPHSLETISGDSSARIIER
jgi:hypothetical protein